MYLVAPTLDDLLRRVVERLLNAKNHIRPTKGPATELTGVLLKIENPRARLSRTESKGTLFSCLGECLWYLSGSNELAFIQYYISRYPEFSDDGKTLYGAYGPRLFSMRGINQVSNVSNMLQNNRDSRQAVIQLFDAGDIVEEHKDIPCTCTLQFFLRDGKLHMLTHMRSNDALIGLPHDAFAFTMLHEIIATSLGAKLGTYKHIIGSLHLYDRDRRRAQQYLDEGWQSKVSMPPMPRGDPWPSIATLLKVEAQLRDGSQAPDISML